MSPICDPWVKAGTAKTYTWDVLDYNGQQVAQATSDILTKKEAMAFLKISEPQFLRLVQLGEINVGRIGRQIRVHRSELERWAKGSK